MKWVKQHYGWVIVAILALLPLLVIRGMLDIEWANGLSISLVENGGKDGGSTLDMLYHVSGEFAIRWMTAVLSCTPFFILFGVTNLFVRQAMGIATAFWSLLHFVIFIWAEGFRETFTQFNYILGLIAVVILIPMLFTSNRRSMRILQGNWKKLQSLVYLVIIVSLLHIAILDKTWLIYAIVVGLGLIIRIPALKLSIIERRKSRR